MHTSWHKTIAYTPKYVSNTGKIKQENEKQVGY